MDLFMGKTKMDIPKDKYELYIVCLHISSRLFEKVYPAIEDYLWITRNFHYRKNDFDLALEAVLKERDFNFIFPTCYTIIQDYIDPGTSSDYFAKILFYAFVLLMNYDYALKYTPAEISQLAIAAAGLTQKCLLDVDIAYNQEIYDYLKSYKYVPPFRRGDAKYISEVAEPFP